MIEPKIPEDADFNTLHIMGCELDECLATIKNVILEEYMDSNDPHAEALRQELLSVERHLEAACTLLGGPIPW